MLPLPKRGQLNMGSRTPAMSRCRKGNWLKEKGSPRPLLVALAVERFLALRVQAFA
jgi:hypothetical protein